MRNHVWRAVKEAVKKWFRDKVEEVVGVGRAVITVLRKGGITFSKIVAMAWAAIKESLPGILVQLLVEKLVAMLIPAGGAIALIIDGIRAAWGAAERILAAFQKFLAFLRAVRSGELRAEVRELVAAAVVAVLDFLSNFLLVKLKGAGQKVGGALSRMAAKLMKVVRRSPGRSSAVRSRRPGSCGEGCRRRAGFSARASRPSPARPSGWSPSSSRAGCSRWARGRPPACGPGGPS